MAPAMDLSRQLLQSRQIDRRYQGYETIMIQPTIMDISSAKQNIWIVKQETKLVKKLFQENQLLIAKPDNNAFIKAYDQPAYYKDRSNYVFNFFSDYRGIYFHSHEGDVKKMIHKLHLQRYLSDPVKIKELLLEDNYGEQEYFAIYMGILICLVLL